MGFLDKLKIKMSISLFSLIVTNLIVLVLAIVQKWNFLTIFYVYFFQTIILWFFSVLKLLFKKNLIFVSPLDDYGRIRSETSEKLERFQIIRSHIKQQLTWFFVFAFFLFFIGELFKPPVFDHGMITGICLFFINHLFSFIYYLKKDNEEKKEQSAKDLTRILAYRFLVILATIWLIGFILKFIVKNDFSFNLVALIILFLLKTSVDVYFHDKEHK